MSEVNTTPRSHEVILHDFVKKTDIKVMGKDGVTVEVMFDVTIDDTSLIQKRLMESCGRLMQEVGRFVTGRHVKHQRTNAARAFYEKHVTGDEQTVEINLSDLVEHLEFFGIEKATKGAPRKPEQDTGLAADKYKKMGMTNEQIIEKVMADLQAKLAE